MRLGRRANEPRMQRVMEEWENEGGARADGTATQRGTGTDRPADARVRARAYEIYCGRRQSGQSGTALSDWAQAEREVGAQSVGATTARERWSRLG